jgi:hypothetical protein
MDGRSGEWGFGSESDICHIRLLTKPTAGDEQDWAMLDLSGGVMENTIPSTISAKKAQPAIERQCDSDSHLLFALGVVLLVCGGAITGHHEVTMVGLGLIIFSSLCDW